MTGLTAFEVAQIETEAVAAMETSLEGRDGIRVAGQGYLDLPCGKVRWRVEDHPWCQLIR